MQARDFNQIIRDLKKPLPSGAGAQLDQARVLVSAAASILSKTTVGQPSASTLQGVCQSLQEQIQFMNECGEQDMLIH